MRTIRSKIILITLAIALLPLIPIGWLAYGLMKQSYEIGVNPQVEQALQQGLTYSRDLYQIQKKELSDILHDLPDERVKEILRQKKTLHPDSIFNFNQQFWYPQQLFILSETGNPLWPAQSDSAWLPGKARLLETEDASDARMVFANRNENQFFAIELRDIGAPYSTVYLCLTAQLSPDYLSSSEQVLKVHQLYQTLDITSFSVPRTLLIMFSVLTLLIAMIAVAVGIWLSRRLTKPLGELVEGTREIGKGNLDYRLTRRRNDEIGDLAMHFNGMAGDLKDSQERTIYLERMAAWQEIARRMAHEIKNPLTPIQLTMQEMVDQYSGDDAEYKSLLKECREIINEEIESLRHLVNEFSAFGRLPEMVKEPVDVNALLTEICGMYSHLELEKEFTDDLPEIELDSDRIRRVVINLIENAAQAMPNGGTIFLKTTLIKHNIQIEVRDTGEGIPSEVVSDIFTPYFSTKSNGMGLGLAITRKIIEEHSGSISVNSVMGEGTVFTILLPVVHVESA